MTYKVWNTLERPAECNVEAVSGDLVYFSFNFVFLVQRTNNENNIICFKYKEGEQTFLEVVEKFLHWCKKEKIQYFRIEGNSRRYKFLLHPKCLEEVKRKGSSILFDDEQSKRIGRNVFYVRVY